MISSWIAIFPNYRLSLSSIKCTTTSGTPNMFLLMSFGSALSFTVGGIFMQLSDGLSKPLPSILVYVLFVMGASLQTLATRQSGMGLTYVLVVGLEAVLAVLFSILFFKEGYSIVKLIGIFLVAMGIMFLRSSAT